jgi:hypothetical protein
MYNSYEENNIRDATKDIDILTHSLATLMPQKK